MPLDFNAAEITDVTLVASGGNTDLDNLSMNGVEVWSGKAPVCMDAYGSNITVNDCVNIIKHSSIDAVANSQTYSSSIFAGKQYVEFEITNIAKVVVGVSEVINQQSGSFTSISSGYGYIYWSGNKINEGVALSYGDDWSVNDVIGIGYDSSTGELKKKKNGTSQGIAYTLNTTKQYHPAISMYAGNGTAVVRSLSTLQYLPSGYKSLSQ